MLKDAHADMDKIITGFVAIKAPEDNITIEKIENTVVIKDTVNNMYYSLTLCKTPKIDVWTIAENADLDENVATIKIEKQSVVIETKKGIHITG